MPLSCDQTYDVFLESCADEPENTRPTFVCRYLNGHDSIKLARLFEQIDAKRPDNWESMSAEERIDFNEKRQEALFDAVLLLVKDAKNVPNALSPQQWPPDDLRALLCPAEADELLNAAFKGQVPDADRKKNSRSQSHGNSTPSAANQSSDAPNAAASDAPHHSSPSPCDAPFAATPAPETDAPNVQAKAKSTSTAASPEESTA